jgi:hypothetical protein
MIIRNLDVIGIPLDPDEAHPPLVIDPRYALYNVKRHRPPDVGR